MGSESRASKFHYDIAMSKRTRKPSNPLKLEANLQACNSSSDEIINGDNEKHEITFGDEALENDSKKSSLKQLIEGRSLSQHFSEEEKQLQLVKQQDEGMNNKVKFKRMVSGYAKVLSHLIKLKRNSDMKFRKKPVLQLTK